MGAHAGRSDDRAEACSTGCAAREEPRDRLISSPSGCSPLVVFWRSAERMTTAQMPFFSRPLCPQDLSIQHRLHDTEVRVRIVYRKVIRNHAGVLVTGR
jgi:hypothetical protein